MTGPAVAGADRFRRRGALERLAARIARFPIAPAARRRLRRLYHVALTIQSRGKGLSRSLPGGEIIRVLPQYEFLTWNVDEYRAFREVVRRGAVALDVGANVGAYSMLLGQWVGPSGAVFAFEPSPQMFEALVRHTELNGLVGVVRPVCAAVGESAIATARFVLSESPGAGHLTSRPARSDRTISVPVTTIDEFCAREGIVPDFIKIDVEGSELDVLRGARETIRARRGALDVFVEMHPSIWPSLGLRREDLLGELQAQALEPRPLISTPDIWATEGVCLRLVAV